MREFRPIGTWALLGVFVVVFFAFGLMDPSTESALRAGAQRSLLVATGEAWRLLSSCFMHFGLLHLLMNGMGIVFIGRWLEYELGTERYLLLFVLAGLGGSAAAASIYDPWTLMGGASGGLFGMLGSLVAVLAREERSYGNALRDPRIRSVLVLIGANIVIGFFWPMISQTAHIGGLVTGFLVTLLWFKLPDAQGRSRWPAPLPALALLLLFGAVVWLALVPVHRDWYRAHQWWDARGERAEQLRASLLESGANEDAVAFLGAIRELRERPAVPLDDPALTVFLTIASRQERYQHVADLGLDPTVFNPLLRSVSNEATPPFDTRGQVPADPWRRSLR